MNHSKDSAKETPKSQKLDLSPFLKALQIEATALMNCFEKHKGSVEKQNQTQKALELLHSSLVSEGKIIVTGLGKSGKIAQKIAATLTSTGSLAVFLHPTEGLHGDIGLLRSNDCLLALSQTGNTDELIQLIPSIRGRGIPVVGIGGNSESRLAKLCDAWLDSSVEQEACPLNLAPTASTTTALALGDAIAVTLMSWRGFQSQDFALSHPGGALGKRLSLSVSDLMIPKSSTHLVKPDASMSEVVESITRSQCGAVLVSQDQETLLGIITDGDLRRALREPSSFFSKTAQALMTSQPVTAESSDAAYSALQKMENRPSQISVLPILCSGKIAGILRLHDLLQEL